jgi:hypothetical protein
VTPLPLQEEKLSAYSTGFSYLARSLAYAKAIASVYMRTDHLEPARLERFMRGESPRPERLAAVRHLLTGCPRCVAVTRRLWDLGELSRPLRIVLEEGLALKGELRQVKASVF